MKIERRLGDFPLEEQIASMEAFASHGVKFMKVTAYGRAKEVCKKWKEILDDNTTEMLEKLMSCQAAFTPMLERFLILVNQIDQTPGITKLSDRLEGGLMVITQDEYESKMFDIAWQRAMRGYNMKKLNYVIQKITGNYTLYLNQNFQAFLNSPDKDLLLKAAAIMCQHYYYKVLPKVIELRSGSGVILEASESGFSSMTIGTLLQKIEELNDDTFGVSTAFNGLKDIIKKHKLLPIEERNLALSVAKVGPHDPFFKERITGSVIMLFSIIRAIINIKNGVGNFSDNIKQLLASSLILLLLLLCKN